MKYLLFMLLLLQIGQSSAQNNKTFTVQGKVIDSSGEPVIYAYIVIDTLNLAFATDYDGNYTLKNVPAGSHQLAAQMIGFKPQTKLVKIIDHSLTGINFTLQEDTRLLDEIVISPESEKEKKEKTAEAVKVIETKEAKFQSADLGEVMAKSEGVSVQRQGGLGSPTNIALNGLSDDKIRFFYNGIPLQFSPFAFGLANVPVNSISRIEIYKGVLPIQFGADALGGAINLVSPAINKGWSGAASYQIGSFNTQRGTFNLEYSNDSSGFFITTGGFVDDTDNNYKIDVAIPNERGTLEQKSVKRFHDAYQAFGTNLKIGVQEKKWAKELSVEGYYGSYYNEIQNPQAPGLVDLPQLGINKAIAGSPFGDLVFTSFSQGLNLNYILNPSEKWEVDFKAGYNYNERVSIDTSRVLYNWLGEVVRRQNQAGEFGEPEHLITESRSFFIRQQLSYKINNNHGLKLAISPTQGFRTGDDLLTNSIYDPALDQSYLSDLVTGLEYRGNWWGEKLQNITFVKNYLQDVRTEGKRPNIEGLQIREGAANNYGAGSGLRMSWTSQFTTKFSYEFAYRMPRLDEIFGDGQLIGRNIELGPENSHNVNLQWSLVSKNSSRVYWQFEGNFFVRRINDLIFLVVDPTGFGIYQNVWSANSQGFELGAKLKNLMKGFNLNVNSTYQSYINTSDQGAFVSFKGDRIPNTPYLFANAQASYDLKNMLFKEDRINIYWSSRYVHPFYIGWESAGIREFKAQTPSQLIHTSGITHKMLILEKQSAISFEIQNLTNAKVFDLFGVQRPGIAFYVKLNIQF